MWQKRIASSLILGIALTACGRQTGGAVTPSVLPPPSGGHIAASTTPEISMQPEQETADVAVEAPSSTATVATKAINHLPPGTEIDLVHVEMLDEKNGWGTGGVKKSGVFNHVFRTVNGGLGWMDVTPRELETVVLDQTKTEVKGYFLDGSTAWVTYHGSIPSEAPEDPAVWRTDDGGATWSTGAPLDTSGLLIYWVSDVLFAGPYGWILTHVGAGMNHDYVALFHSTDSGWNWNRILDPTQDGGIQSCTKTGLLFINKSEGWLTGTCNGVAPGAYLQKTEDGGRSWVPITLPAPEVRADLFTSMDSVCTVREPLYLEGTLHISVSCDVYAGAKPEEVAYHYSSVDGGRSWGYTDLPGGVFYPLDSGVGWALGGDIYRTEDGGVTWEKMSSVTWDGRFNFLSPQLGFAIAQKESEYGLVRTTDGGRLWQLLAPVVVATP